MEKKTKFSHKDKESDYCVAIFGSARIRKNSAVYRQIFELGKLLGERGIDIVTGGGPGLMEAANAGHEIGSKGTGSHRIGLNITLPNVQKPNKHLDVKREFSRFSKRLDEFMYLSNAIVVSPGGVGTLLELFYAWQLTQVEHVCEMPIILLGNQWPPFVRWLERYPLQQRYFDKKDLRMLFLAKDCAEAIKMIDTACQEYKKGNKNFCLNCHPSIRQSV